MVADGVKNAILVAKDINRANTIGLISPPLNTATPSDMKMVITTVLDKKLVNTIEIPIRVTNSSHGVKVVVSGASKCCIQGIIPVSGDDIGTPIITTTDTKISRLIGTF